MLGTELARVAVLLIATDRAAIKSVVGSMAVSRAYGSRSCPSREGTRGNWAQTLNVTHQAAPAVRRSGVCAPSRSLLGFLGCITTAYM